jgi:hypothetical protein
LFEDLYDSISLVGCWRWPSVQGEITAVDIERMSHHGTSETFRLAVAYKFYVGDDGPYTGESFWAPAFSFRASERVRAARHKLRVHQKVSVHYRRDDPSVNRIVRAVWTNL